MLPQTDPSPAFIFRDAESNCGTQLFDEVERLTDADRKSQAPHPNSRKDFAHLYPPV